MSICCKNVIYYIDTKVFENQTVFDYWREKISDERREKLDCIKPMRSKCLSLGAAVLLEKGFSLCCSKVSQVSEDYIVEKNSFGKPYIKGISDAYFNISHSGDYAVCAFSDREVGIDIERVRHFDESLIKRVFGEQEEICDEDLLCTRLWTIKESVMKYFGKGLSIDPRDISYLGNGRVKCKGYDCENLRITSMDFADGYRLSVCSEYEDFDKLEEVMVNN